MENNKSKIDNKGDGFWQKIIKSVTKICEKKPPELISAKDHALRSRNSYTSYFLDFKDEDETPIEASVKCDSVISKKGFLQVSSDIVVDRFLRKIKTSPGSKGILIISDEESREMINKALDSSTLKKKGISCIFDIKDLTPDEELKPDKHLNYQFTLHMDTVYLINVEDLNDDDFGHLIDDIERRQSLSSAVFLTGEEEDTSKSAKLRDAIEKKRMTNNEIIGAFNAFDPYVALIDSGPNLGYIHAFLDPINMSTTVNANHSDSDTLISRKLAYRLVNVFEQMNECPTVRHYRGLHNKNISETFVQRFDERRKEKANSRRSFQSNCTLIIIDRSIDLLTPIAHSVTFQPFVFQELERLYNTLDEKVDECLRDTRIQNVTQELIALSQRLRSSEVKQTPESRKMQRNISLQKHTENAERMNSKLKNGYLEVLKVENEMLEEASKTKKYLDERVRKLLNSTYTQILPLDIVRLLTIYSLREGTDNVITKKLLKNSKRPLTDSEISNIKLYSNLANKVLKNGNVSLQSLAKRPMISQIIDGFIKRTLSEEMFPTVFKSPKKTDTKLFIFGFGGLSFAEIQFAGNYPKHGIEVFLFSDGLYTSRMFYDQLFSNDRRISK